MNEAEYEAALARAWELMDAEPGTPDEDELKALAAKLEAYETATEDWTETPRHMRKYSENVHEKGPRLNVGPKVVL